MLQSILKYMTKFDGGVHTIAIDGRCAAGKTTLSELLSERTGAGVIHMDDFFLPADMRTAERLQAPGGNVHYERFIEEVLPNLKKAEHFTYRRFDCGKMTLSEERTVAASHWRIVEGAYSNHPAFGDYADIKVFLNVEKEEQLRRISKRNGEEALAVFRSKWIPMEERYFAAFEVENRADLVLGTF